MEAVVERPKRIVTRGARVEQLPQRVKVTVTLDRKTAAKLAAYSRWHGKEQCAVVEESLKPTLADVRLGGLDDSSGQDDPST